MAPIAARRDGSWGSRRASAHSRRERSSTSGDDFICRRFVKCESCTTSRVKTIELMSQQLV